jgi:hypothetical protein
MPTFSPIGSKHALILGAGPGLSASVARRFGREGFAVTLVARRGQALAELDELRAEGSPSTSRPPTPPTRTASAPHWTSWPSASRPAWSSTTRRSSPATACWVSTSATCCRATRSTSSARSAPRRCSPPPCARRRSGRSWPLAATPASTRSRPTPRSRSARPLRAAVSLLHKELKNDGVHATSIQIAGAIAPDTPFAPDRIAETYWTLHTQPAAGWTAETVFDGQ